MSCPSINDNSQKSDFVAKFLAASADKPRHKAKPPVVSTVIPSGSSFNTQAGGGVVLYIASPFYPYREVNAELSFAVQLENEVSNTLFSELGGDFHWIGILSRVPPILIIFAM